MGNKAAGKQGRNEGKKHVLDREQMMEMLGYSSSSTQSNRGRYIKQRSSSQQSINNSGTLQRKTSFLNPPPVCPTIAKLADRWDCENCGCSNEGTGMVCFGCKTIRC